jgi:photosystem II stability/assembly factor-like uncharacterized protein
MEESMAAKRTQSWVLAFATILMTTGFSAANPVLIPGVWTTLLRDSVANPYAGQGMAIDPNHPSTLYYSVLQQGLFKSTDAGSHWRRICKVQRDWHNLDTLGGSIRVRIDPKNSNHLYMGQGVIGWMGFFVSWNGGDSVYTPKGFTDFQQATGITGWDIYDIAADPADFNHVLLTSHSPWAWGSTAYGNGSGVLESTDGGNSWRACAMQASFGTGTNIWFLNNSGTWLLGTQNDGYYRTNDSGNHWTQVTSGYQLSMSHGGGQMYKARNGVLYATCFTGIIRSTDNGITWALVTGGGAPTFCGGIGSDGTYLYSKRAYGGSIEPYARALESDGLTWTTYPQGGQWAQGPFEMAFDSVNGILYSSSWNDGFMAMKTPGSTAAVRLAPAQLQNRAAAPGALTVTTGGAIVRQAGRGNLFNVKGERIGAVRISRQAAVMLRPASF